MKRRKLHLREWMMIVVIAALALKFGKMLYKDRVIFREAFQPSQINVWCHLCDRPSIAVPIAPGSTAAVP